MKHHSPKPYDVDDLSSRSLHLHRDPARVTDESTFHAQSDVTALVPPDDPQVLSAEGIRLSIHDLFEVIRTKVWKVDQLHEPQCKSCPADPPTSTSCAHIDRFPGCASGST